MNLNILRHKSKTKLLRTKEQKQTIPVVLLTAKLIQSPEFDRYLELRNPFLCYEFFVYLISATLLDIIR